RSALSSAGPEMMSGVRASSMRMESTSSTIALFRSRCTYRNRSTWRVLHVVAQVIEAELVVGAVGDVGAIGDLLLEVGLAVAVPVVGEDDAHVHAQELVDADDPAGHSASRVAR